MALPALKTALPVGLVMLAACGGGLSSGDPGPIQEPLPDAAPASAAVFSEAATCTSGTMWTRGNEESELMNPGQACNACHATMGGPVFSFGGTVYATGHDPDNCNGTSSAGVVVEVTDARGAVVRVRTNSAGNFFTSTAITPPYTARVIYNGRERRMGTRQTSGDCNSCHTASGRESAPGRIALP